MHTAAVLYRTSEPRSGRKPLTSHWPPIMEQSLSRCVQSSNSVVFLYRSNYTKEPQIRKSVKPHMRDISKDRKIMLEKIRNYAPKTALQILHYARKTSNYARKCLLFLMC